MANKIVERPVIRESILDLIKEKYEELITFNSIENVKKDHSDYPTQYTLVYDVFGIEITEIAFIRDESVRFYCFVFGREFDKEGLRIEKDIQETRIFQEVTQGMAVFLMGGIQNLFGMWNYFEKLNLTDYDFEMQKYEVKEGELDLTIPTSGKYIIIKEYPEEYPDINLFHFSLIKQFKNVFEDKKEFMEIVTIEEALKEFKEFMR